jgi:hypothetical protein
MTDPQLAVIHAGYGNLFDTAESKDGLCNKGKIVLPCTAASVLQLDLVE